MPTDSSFRYHANAQALSGYLNRPVQRVIEVQAGTTLPATGGHSHTRVENYRFDGFVSFKAGYSHVSGSEKGEDNKTIYTTLATTTVEGLNILDVVTADRIVSRLSSSQISGDEPRILVIGSRIENLRIAGYPIEVELDHELAMHLDTFAAVRKEFARSADFRKIASGSFQSKKSPKDVERNEGVGFSLVRNLLCAELPGIRRGDHREVLVVPGFGSIHLAEVLVEQGRKSLTMLRVELGSPTAGRIVVGTAEAGGTSQPFTETESQFAPARPVHQVLSKDRSLSREEDKAELAGTSKSPVSLTNRPPRYANAALFDPASTEPRDSRLSLSQGAVVLLRLDIGPLSLESQVTGARPFPDDGLPPEINLDLDVMVSSTDFGVAPDSDGAMGLLGGIAHGLFFLPSNGYHATTPKGSRYLHFYLAPKSLEQARARIGYYYRNILVQSQLLIANVTQPGGFQITTDFTLSDDLTKLESFPRRPRISILTNANGDGTHQVVLRKPGTTPGHSAQGETFAVRETTVGKIIKDIREILGNRAPKGRQRTQTELRDDLTQLAPKGRELWREVPGKNPRMFAPLEKDPASHVIQVSRPTTSGFVFPWALIYDIPLTTDRPEICKLVTDKKPLVSGSPRECPYGPHEENVLCPFGFWGFRYSIDQLSSTKDSVFSIPAPDEWDFVVAETQDKDAIKALPHHVDELRKTLGTRFPRAHVREGKSKDEIRRLLGNDLPLVYFYCHGNKFYDASPDTHLGVGMNESIMATELEDWVQIWLKQDKMIWEKIRPLVFINACHSVEIHPETLVSYLDALVGSAHAAGVIGTEVRVNQDLAMNVAEQFFDLLLVQQKLVDGQSQPLNVDEALRKIRLDYLADGNLLGLVYTPYCWSELCLTRLTT
jgi:hypothetical protein